MNPEAGWYPDPHDSSQLRWWNGSAWSVETRPAATSAPPPTGTAVEPAQPPQTQPAEPESTGGFFGTVAKIGLGSCLGLVVFVVGCAGIIGLALDSAEEELQATAITRAEFDAVTLGMTQEQVEQQLGEPEDSQEFEDRFGGQTSSSSCIYYSEEGQELFEGDSYQLCFTSSVLDSKNVY